MGSNRQKYIHDSARTAMGQLGIHSLDFRKEDSATGVAGALAKAHWLDVLNLLRWKHSDATLGKLVACGLGKNACLNAEKRDGVSIMEVAGEGWLDEKYAGRLILEKTATAALLAAMADNVWADINRT